jgi:antitoxin (DNA-binding transcriptional repressor) of toxin-antitoxin stability system
MKAIEEYEVQIQFSSLLTKIEKEGETFLICRNGKPVADLMPHKNKAETPESESNHKEVMKRVSLLQRLKALNHPGIVLPTKKPRKASMPTIKVTGKPLSQMIIEDRR